MGNEYRIIELTNNVTIIKSETRLFKEIMTDTMVISGYKIIIASDIDDFFKVLHHDTILLPYYKKPEQGGRYIHYFEDNYLPLAELWDHAIKNYFPFDGYKLKKLPIDDTESVKKNKFNDRIKQMIKGDLRLA